MCQMRRLLVTLLLGLLAACLLLGCRFWEPETVIVNKPPKIYIIGAPAETSGAYFHFHVFWYGTDEDGYVERYVWALTDTSVQDRRTIQDQEDQRFNPHLDVSHLEIGNWTTRTDTIFDFRIEQGSRVQRDMTLHMVAVDDQGAFSRRPARLHFFSNALGTPRLRFYRDDAFREEFRDGDYLGYGRPLHLRWTGTTPNIAGYDTNALRQVDTVGVRTDGLLGFKWRLPQLDGCNPSVEDCWQPRRYNEATGESLSYFADLGELKFWNDGSGTGFFRRRLNAGNLQLQVNTIDVAGVEVRPERRSLNIQVNYPPAAYIVGAPNPPEQPPMPPEHIATDLLPQGFEDEYPYFIVFHGPESRDPATGEYVRHPFPEVGPGEIPRIPDGAYVVFMALGWEQSYVEDEERIPYDLLSVFPDKPPMQFQGNFVATGIRRVGTRRFTFRSTRSPLQNSPDWTAGGLEVAEKASADTLGFLVGPFEYEVLMQSADEHETRSEAATYLFAAGFPPCIQGIEVANNDQNTRPVYGVYLNDYPCVEPQITPRSDLNECTFLEIRGYQNPDWEVDERCRLVQRSDSIIFVNPSAGLVRFEQPQTGTWIEIPGFRYHYRVFLHGRDGIEPDGRSREYWPPGQPHRRIAAWQYQIDYERDWDNVIKDAGDTDDITRISGFDVGLPPPTGMRILEMNASDDPADPSYSHHRGAWELLVTVSVPQALINGSAQSYWTWIQEHPQVNSEADAREVYRLTTMQLSPGTIRAIALDQSLGQFRPLTNCYNVYEGTRTPAEAQNLAHRRCAGTGSGVRSYDLSVYAQDSNRGNPDLIHRRDFEIRMYHSNGALFDYQWVPPGHIGSSSSGVSSRQAGGLWR